MALVTTQTSFMQYNGVTLGPLWHSSISAVPVMDSSQRTTKFVRFAVKFDGTAEPAAGDTTTDNMMLDLRRRLSENGGIFLYKGVGYNTLDVNGGAVKDVMFGPVVKLIDWQPTGGPGVAARVSWQLETCIPVCADAVYQFGIMELNTTLQQIVDEDCYSKLTISGHIEIPMTRRAAGDTTLTDHVDKYRDQFQGVPPRNFTRTTFDWKVSESRTRADFTVAYEEKREPLPTGCTRATFTHKTSSPGPAFIMWKNQISGSITVPPNMPKKWAMSKFMDLITNREAVAAGAAAQEIQQLLDGAPNNGAVRQRVGNHARFASIPEGIEVSNEVGGRSASFGYSFRVVRRNTLQKVVLGNGVWNSLVPQAAPAAWSQWLDAMRRLGALSPRGTAGIVWRPGDEGIVDLCAPRPNPVQKVLKVAPPPPPARRALDARDQPAPPRVAEVGAAGGEDVPDVDGAATGKATAYLPAPEHTWLLYEMDIVYEEPTGRYAYHQPLAGKLQDGAGYDATGKAAAVRAATGGAVGSATWTGAKAILQEVGPPRGVVRLVGRALRIGWDIPLPNLLSLKGAVAKRNRIIATRARTVGRWGDLRLIYRTWDIEFFLDQPPTRPLPQPVHPVEGLDGAA